jgi:hypothetical protein
VREEKAEGAARRDTAHVVTFRAEALGKLELARGTDAAGRNEQDPGDGRDLSRRS